MPKKGGFVTATVKTPQGDVTILRRYQLVTSEDADGKPVVVRQYENVPVNEQRLQQQRAQLVAQLENVDEQLSDLAALKLGAGNAEPVA